MSMNQQELSAALSVAQVKSFNKPDEVRDFPKGRLELTKIGGATIGRAIFEPGWRWANSVQPIANTKSCEAPHFQYHVSGVLHIKMDDGSEFDCNPGDVSLLPSGHDAWTVGEEPAIVVDFQGMIDYAAGHEHTETPGLLDGNSYRGMFIEKGKTSGDEDTLSFSDGRFHSSACDQYGYGDAVYSAIMQGDAVHFDAETRSPRYGKLIWKGVVKGDKISCDVLMVQVGKPPIENFINATRVA